MRTLLSTLLILGLCSFTQGQTIMERYFKSGGGAADIATCAHLTNTYERGTYEIGDNYVWINVYYEDTNMNDEQIRTQIRLHKGTGELYFDGLYVTNDNDDFPAMVAFAASTILIVETMKEANPEKYNEIRNSMITALNTDPEKWDSAGWALFAMNLSYANYLLN